MISIFKFSPNRDKRVSCRLDTKSIDSSLIQADSTLRETFDIEGNEFLILKERAIISFDEQRLQIQSLKLTVEPSISNAQTEVFPLKNAHQNEKSGTVIP